MLSGSGTYVLLTCFQLIILLVNFASSAAELNHKPFSNGKPGLGCCRVEEGAYLLARLPFPPLSHRQSVSSSRPSPSSFLYGDIVSGRLWLVPWHARRSVERTTTTNTQLKGDSGLWSLSVCLSVCLSLSLSLSPAGTQLNSLREMPPVELERS